jgi:hypothetical protein
MKLRYQEKYRSRTEIIAQILQAANGYADGIARISLLPRQGLDLILIIICGKVVTTNIVL